MNIIFVSGGLDSGILLNIVPDIFDKIAIIPKFDGAEKYARNVIAYTESRTGLKFETILVGNPNLYHAEIGKSAYEQVFDEYPDAVIYWGSNRIPPADEFDYSGFDVWPQRGKSSERSVMPFKNLYKWQLIQLAERHNLQGLYPITHTCTEFTDKECGECWQCKERIWGFSKLGLVDPAHAL